jgi:hypothetical protein
MPTFLFWYLVFLVGAIIGATVGSSFGNSFGLVAGLLSGIAISGWIAEQLRSIRWSSATNAEKPLVQPKPSETQPPTQELEGLERIRFASAPLGPNASGTDILLGSFSLPKGMSEFAMRKRIERQSSSPNTQRD